MFFHILKIVSLTLLHVVKCGIFIIVIYKNNFKITIGLTIVLNISLDRCVVF